MPEWGFAVDCTDVIKDKGEEAARDAVRHMLRKNYDQWVAHCVEEGRPMDTTIPPRLMPGPHEPQLAGENTYAWYVNSDNPEQYEDLEILEPINA